MVEAVKIFDGWFSLQSLHSIDSISRKYALVEEREEALDDLPDYLSKWA